MTTTSPSLVEELMSRLQGAPLQQMAQQLGTDPAQTEQAVGTALPLLLGTLGRNVAQPEGAANLFGALQRDHGNTLDLGGLLGSMLGSGGGASASAVPDGGAILGHIFGGQRQQAEAGLGQATGLGPQAGQLLQMLAPVVMAFLAQRTRGGGLDAGGLGQVLGQEKEQLRNQGGLGGGLLGSLLDQDGDGQVGMGDLLKIGGSLLGGRR